MRALNTHDSQWEDRLHCIQPDVLVDSIRSNTRLEVCAISLAVFIRHLPQHVMIYYHLLADAAVLARYAIVSFVCRVCLQISQ